MVQYQNQAGNGIGGQECQWDRHAVSIGVSEGQACPGDRGPMGQGANGGRGASRAGMLEGRQI